MWQITDFARSEKFHAFCVNFTPVLVIREHKSFTTPLPAADTPRARPMLIINSMRSPIWSKSKNPEVLFARIVSVFALIILAAGGLRADEQKSPTTNTVMVPTDLLLREVHYDGKLSDAQARFTVDIDAESPGKSETSITLFDGDVAVMPSKLPSGLRMVREGRQYRLIASKPGRYKFKLELVAKI